MAGNLYVTLRGNRGDEWQRAIGQRTFPVTTAEPVAATILGDNGALVFFVDLTELPGIVRDRIEHYLAHKFSMTLDELRFEVKHGGVPILAKDLRTPTGLEI